MGALLRQDPIIVPMVRSDGRCDCEAALAVAGTRPPADQPVALRCVALRCGCGAGWQACMPHTCTFDC
jgi:hypothetical protein